MTAIVADVSVVLLAGGLGTRIRSLYPNVPKPMIEAAGQPFLFWVTSYLAHCGLRKFVISSGYKGNIIDQWASDGSMPGLRRHVCHESSPLGTGGALFNCLPQCGEWVLVANGDSLCLGGVTDLIAHIDSPDSDGGIVSLYQADTSRYGSLDIDEAGRITAMREKVPGSGYINGGIYLFRTRDLRRMRIERPCSIERDIIPRLLEAGLRFHAVRLDDVPFLDIGTPETVTLAEEFLRHHSDAFQWT